VVSSAALPPSIFFPFVFRSASSSAGPFAVHTRQCLTFFLFHFVFLFFLLFLLSPLLYKLRLVKPDICVLVFVFGRPTSSSPFSMDISRLRHRPRRGHLPPRNRPPRPPHLPLSCGAAQRQATGSGQAMPSRVNGRRRRMSFRLLSSFAPVARTDAGPRSGPRSSRARDITACLCASGWCLFLFLPLLTLVSFHNNNI